MALTPCHECGRQISTLADFCPHCGAPPIVEVPLVSSLPPSPATPSPAPRSPAPRAEPQTDTESQTDTSALVWSIAGPAILLLFLAVLAALMAAGDLWQLGAMVWTLAVVLGLCWLAWACLIVPIIVGHHVGLRRGNPTLGTILGFCTGWIGVGLYKLAVPAGQDPPGGAT